MAHGPSPFDCTGKELRCEAMTNAVVTSKSQSEIPRTISSVCQFAESVCQNGSVPIYLVGAERSGVFCRDDWIPFEAQIREVSIPNSVTELCDGCFRWCESLRRVTFGPSSSLERIGVACFVHSGVEEFDVPDSVRELCDDCFYVCESLHRVTFGSSSSLERIGVSCFEETGVQEVRIPDGVRDLCCGCFKGCSSLRRVTFGPSTSLDRIGVEAFGAAHNDKLWSPSGLVEMSIPDGVRELCDGCFSGCCCLHHVTFGPSSSLERIGVEAFGAVVDDWDLMLCELVEISIPDSVRELCDGCFKGCSSLRRVTFGPSSSLERIGVEAFGAVEDYEGEVTECGLVEISIPDSVCELCDGCFKGCSSLRRVTFGPLSSLERVGAMCFYGCSLVEFTMPVSVRSLMADHLVNAQ